MTPAELRRLVEDEITVPLLTALEALGISETAGRHALKRNELPFRVLRVGKALRVPTCDLAATLLDTPDSSEDPAPTGSIALTDESEKGTRDDQRPTLHALKHA